MRRGYWQLVGLFLLLALLAACGTISQQVLQSPTPASTLTATTTNGSSGLSLGVPAHIVTARPTTPHSSMTPAPPVQATSPSQSNSAPLRTSTESQLEQQLFDLINKDRASEAGRPAYTLNSVMSDGARLHSWKMASCGLSHQCSGELAPCDRVSKEGISWTTCGENVGYSSPSPTAWDAVQAIEKSMLNEPPPAGHRANLLSSSFHRIGIGIYIDTKGYVWISEDFAN